jgi:hypothetical protein
MLAAAGPGLDVRLFGVLTGQEIGTFRGHQGGVIALAFDATGNRLVSGSLDTTALVWDATGPAIMARPARVSGSLDTTALVWDATGPAKKARPARGRLAEGAADELWTDLAGDDAEKAFAAMRALCEAPEDAAALLKRRLRPVSAPDPKHVTRLIGDLDAKSFAVRRNAAAELEALGDLIGPAARRAVGGGASLEVRQRLEPILKKLRVRAVRGEPLAALRGVEVLERVGTAEARRVLEALAGGAAGSRLTEAARDSLKRSARRE